MKDTGIVRKVDELGRIVLPIELRRTMDIQVRDPVAIFVEGQQIIIKKHHSTCLFCGSEEQTVSHKGKKVCVPCIRELGVIPSSLSAKFA